MKKLLVRQKAGRGVELFHSSSIEHKDLEDDIEAFEDHEDDYGDGDTSTSTWIIDDGAIGAF